MFVLLLSRWDVFWSLVAGIQPGGLEQHDALPWIKNRRIPLPGINKRECWVVKQAQQPTRPGGTRMTLLSRIPLSLQETDFDEALHPRQQNQDGAQ